MTASNMAMAANTLSIPAVTRCGESPEDSAYSSVITPPAASAGSMPPIARCTSAFAANGSPAVRTTSVIVVHGVRVTGTYTTGASGGRPTFGLWRASPTTPTIVVTNIDSATNEIRLPIGSSLGQY